MFAVPATIEAKPFARLSDELRKGIEKRMECRPTCWAARLKGSAARVGAFIQLSRGVSPDGLAPDSSGGHRARPRP
jgi:hypothetical protein